MLSNKISTLRTNIARSSAVSADSEALPTSLVKSDEATASLYICAVATKTETTDLPAGSQTLARGLSALELICGSGGGLTIQEVAEQLGVHRTVASRLL